MKYLPYALFLAAIAAALGYAKIEDPVPRRLSAALFPILGGSAALLWGFNELRSGQALVRYHYASRTRQPFVFWTVIIVFRFALGGILLAAGLWYLSFKVFSGSAHPG